MQDWQRVLLYSALWAGFGVVSGYVVTKIPSRWLHQDRWLLRLQAFEERGRWYDRRLRLRRWKDRLPEAGGLFGGSSKRTVGGVDRAALAQFAVETRRAEVVHWANVVFGFTFAIWTPWPTAIAMVVFGLVVHLPFIAVQRYNRARIASILATPAPTGIRTAGVDIDPSVADAAAAGGWRRARRVMVRLGLASLVVAVIAGAISWATKPRAEPVSVDAARAAAKEAGAPETEAALLMPKSGVYAYAGSGTERLSRPPTEQPQGPEMPGTVTAAGDGCWSFRIDYSSIHWQRWDYCVEGGRLIERGGESFQQLDLAVIAVDVSTTTTCDAAVVAIDLDAAPGSTAEQRCVATTTGSDSAVTSSGPLTFVGSEPVDVNGITVDAVRYRRDRTFSGNQRGFERLELWFDAETGLPLVNQRSIELITSSPLGELTYTETGEFRLTTLDPV